MAKKRAPKRSSTADKVEPIIIGVLLVILLLAGAYLFLSNGEIDNSVVARINGEDLTQSELSWWYKISVPEDFRDRVTEKEFLENTLISQIVLMQEAELQGIVATEDDIDQLIGIYIIEQGITLDEFSDQLESRELTLDEVRKTFEVRVTVLRLFNAEGLDFDFEEGQVFFDQNNLVFQDYVSALMDAAEIEILLAGETYLRETGEKCDDTSIRLFVTSTCDTCKDSTKIFKTAFEGEQDAKLWVLDKGDNLMTSKKEAGVSKEELSYFNEYANKKVPSLVVGCSQVFTGEITTEVVGEVRDS